MPTPRKPADRAQFNEALRALVDAHGMQYNSDIPENIIADFLTDCLAALDRAVLSRDLWAQAQADGE